jgi:hypothetical protein
LLTINNASSNIQEQIANLSTEVDEILPSPSGESGKYLTNDGQFLFWDDVEASPHAASHASGGSDAITIAQSQVTNLTTDLSAKAPINNPTFTGTVIGVPSDGISSGGANGFGYKAIPKVYESGVDAYTGPYTVQNADVGKFIKNEATRTITIPSNETYGFDIGTTFVFVATGYPMTIQVESPGVLRLVGSGATGSRTLATHGMATVIQTDLDNWYISGNGLT